MTKKEFQELKEHMDQRFDSISDEYRQLVEFIAPRFDDLGRRLTRVEVLGEENRHQIQIVAEGVTAVDRKLEAFRGEVKEEFREVRDEMAVGFQAVRSEMAEGFQAVRSEMAEGFDAQGKLIRGLGGRVERLEARRA